MPINSSSNKAASPHWRRWLRALLVACLAFVLALIATIYYATRHLPRLAKWALERAFPGATVEIRKLDFDFPDRLTAESVTLKSRKDGATLLTLAGGSITFSFDELRRKQIGEVRLVQPVINASPRLLEAFTVAPAAKTSSKAGPPWGVRKFICDYGELNIGEYGPPGLTVRSKFRFDFNSFSPSTAPQEIHELILWDLTAATHSNSLLTLAGGSITFSFDDLRRGQIGEVRLLEPVINASPRLVEAFAVAPGTKSSPEAGATWGVRKVVCDHGELNFGEYGPPGLTVRSKFRFDLKNFSPSTAGQEIHELIFWDLTAATHSNPLLTLAGGSITFSFDDLRRGQIGEVRLLEPVINASPRLLEASAVAPGTKSSPEAGPAWGVRKFVCAYGELNFGEYGPPGLAVRSKFCFDLKNFSPATAAQEIHELILWDLSATTRSNSPFLRVDLARAKFDLDRLINKQALNALTLEGGSLVFGKSLREVFADAQTPQNPAGASSPPSAWTVGSLDIKRIAVRLDDERPQVTDITFALNTSLKNVPLSKTASSLGSEQQLVEIANLQVLSPLDPFTKVLTLDSIFVRFTLAGLLRREIDSLTILGPNIFLGEDLFWYMDDMQKRLGIDAGKDSGPGWNIKNLGVEFGRLTLGSGGRTRYGLPLSFRTSAQDVSLDNLAALKLQAVLEIPPQKYVFDSYQLEFTSEKGELRFAYPPEKKVNNLVGMVRIKAIRWRQYRAANSYISVTFDRNGINGLFGGRVYRGETWGGFSFFFSADSPWIGWLSGKGISLRELTDIISPQNFQLSGPLDFRLQMDAKRRDIERVLGDFRAAKPGKMVIRKIDDLLARIPTTWHLLKQSSTRIALETLRDFDYTKGGGDFWFVGSQGVLRLKLQGPTGSRNFEIVLHAEDSPQGRWKQRSATR